MYAIDQGLGCALPIVIASYLGFGLVVKHAYILNKESMRCILSPCIKLFNIFVMDKRRNFSEHTW